MLLVLLNMSNYSYGEKSVQFCIVSPSYNNAEYYQENIESVLKQTYKNWQMYIIDDNSTDNNAELIEQYITKHNLASQITLIKNKENMGAMANIYNAIHQYCTDDMVVGILDGDDLLSTQHALEKVAKAYQSKDNWLVYSQYQDYSLKFILGWRKGKLGCSGAFDQETMDENLFRESQWLSSHFRTFYSWLFKKIKRDDLLYKGKFISSAPDMAIMFPMLEMASKGHIEFIPEVLYTYRRTAINEDKVRFKDQRFCDGYIRRLNKYQPLLKESSR
jgi:glycosyltransferase involved in cell wall biosynthesis